MTGRVLQRPQARKDISQQARFIAEDNPAAAERFIGAVERALAQLADMPGLGAARNFGRVEGLRMWHVPGFEKHLIFYRPLPDGVEVSACCMVPAISRACSTRLDPATRHHRLSSTSTVTPFLGRIRNHRAAPASTISTGVHFSRRRWRRASAVSPW